MTSAQSVTSTTTNTSTATASNNNSNVYHPITEAPSSQALQALMVDDPPGAAGGVTRTDSGGTGVSSSSFSPPPPQPPILPQQPVDDFMAALDRSLDNDLLDDNTDDTDGELSLQLEEMDPGFYSGEEDSWSDSRGGTGNKKHEWLLRMNRKLQEIPVGDLDPATVPLSAVMNAWAKTKSAQGADMVELWLKRAQQEYDAGNRRVVPTTKMYTMAGK